MGIIQSIFQCMYFGSSGLLCLRFCYVSFVEHRERLDAPMAHPGFKISPAFLHFLESFVQDRLSSDISRCSCTTVCLCLGQVIGHHISKCL